MGLFDTFDVKAINCPVCGKKIEDGQTKDLDRSLAHFKIGDELPYKNKIFNLFVTCGYVQGRGFHYAKDIRAEIKNGIYIGELHGRTH